MIVHHFSVGAAITRRNPDDPAALHRQRMQIGFGRMAATITGFIGPGPVFRPRPTPPIARGPPSNEDRESRAQARGTSFDRMSNRPATSHSTISVKGRL